jgi:hypothetical protein
VLGSWLPTGSSGIPLERLGWAANEQGRTRLYRLGRPGRGSPTQPRVHRHPLITARPFTTAEAGGDRTQRAFAWIENILQRRLLTSYTKEPHGYREFSTDYLLRHLEEYLLIQLRAVGPACRVHRLTAAVVQAFANRRQYRVNRHRRACEGPVTE